MGNKRFSLTTYALVGISLVALYFVGKSVNPPPAPPPPVVTKPTTPVKAPPTPAMNEQSAKATADRQKEMARRRAEAMREAANKPKTASTTKEPAEKFNPNMIQTGADYWHQNQMGKKGEAEMDLKVAAAKKAPQQKTTPPEFKHKSATLPPPVD
jgi:hypothetical protein